jgi:hypothetical protein
MNYILNLIAANPGWTLITVIIVGILVDVVFSKKPVAPFVDVGTAVVTVSFDDESEVTREFTGYAFWIPAFHPDSVINYDAASLATEFINSDNPIKFGDGRYYPRPRVTSYHMTVESLVRQATK